MAAAEVDEFLTLAGNGRLLGYEVAVIRGLTVEGMVRLGHRTKLTTHADAMERGLAKKPERESLDVRQDHEPTPADFGGVPRDDLEPMSGEPPGIAGH